MKTKPKTQQLANPITAPPPPADTADRELLANVRPPAWQNPEPKERYHLVVVGAGSGGLVSAAIAAALGAQVALIERHLMGGDCLNVGCVPSKGIIRAARAWQNARDAAERFGGPLVAGEGDFAAAMGRMRRIRAEISEADSAERFREMGIDVFFGDARFFDRERVQVDGQTLRFHRAIIATGGRPRVPGIPGLVEADPLTNETIWDLAELPPRLGIIGAGPIGCEMAQTFARFGSRVTLLDQMPRILASDDPAAARVVLRSLQRDGVAFVGGADLRAVERDGDGYIVRYARDGEEESLAVDRLLVAAGRAPNVEGLGLDAAGVRFGKGGIEINDRLQTSTHRIFAVGDITTAPKFTHMADAMARLAVPNALFYGRGKWKELVVPWVTYTTPELAHVGMVAAEVEERGEEIETITIPFDKVDRARLDGEDEGFLRVHLESGSDRILGATLVAEHAGEIISQITQAMTAGVGLGKLSKTIFPYPTQAEAIRKAADEHRRKKLTPRVQKAFELFFRLVG